LESKANLEAAGATRKIGEKQAQGTLVSGIGSAAFAGAGAF
jgi:hypothetical protein